MPRKKLPSATSLAPTKVLHCAFCGASQYDVEKLIVGREDLCICDHCILVSLDILISEGYARRDRKQKRKGSEAPPDSQASDGPAA